MRFVVSVLIVLVCAALGKMQDCKTSGKLCMDDGQCCGGCCINGECIDTFRPCYMPYELCRSHTCLGEESCIVYTPPQCPGCPPIAVCKPIE